ncbi:MAG: DEAD/DEAH box helicase family protein [Alphaproteobacteria bacterium]
MSQFGFLIEEFGQVHKPALRAEELAVSDPRGACFYARRTLELLVVWMYDRDPALRRPYNDSLSALIHEGSFRGLVGADIVTKAKIIKDLGNMAVHDTRPVTTRQSFTAVRELFHVCYWLARSYARKQRPDPTLAFRTDRLEARVSITASTIEQIKKKQAAAETVQKQLEEEKAKRLADAQSRAELEQQIAALQAEIKQVREANEQQPDTHDYNEEKTRDDFIDLLLREAGWTLEDERDREFEVTGMPSDSGIGFADYVLWGDDGKPLAVVEAKATRHDARKGQHQGKLYADCLEQMFGQRPVIFCSNGYDHWLWDDHSYPPRRVQGFYSKAELELMIQRRGSLRPLAQLEPDAEIAGRYYQERAIRRVGEVFEEGNHRKALLVMATGSGKTRTVIGLIDWLMRANMVKRVLFLADRIALVRQGHNAFKEHLKDTPSANLLQSHDATKNNHADARVCLSTYPTMMSKINEMSNGSRSFGVGHFDLVVIDEAHRSVYRKYRAIFDWFDSLLVGLTATPRDEIDRDTYSLFELERGMPTDSYDLEQAVSDGHLVPPEVISVPLKFQREGINYDDLSDEEKEEWDALEWSEDGDEPPPDRVSAAAMNKWLFNTDTVDKVLQHLMENGLKVDEGDKLGKTIIFAKNSKHAQFIAERFNANYPQHKGQFAQVIDYSVDYAQSLIDDFSDPEKLPQIAISVDMLDTGIDVPEVLNLVFFKMVRSKTKFWQMIGRGTRLCEDLFGPGRDKQSFRIFDFCMNFEYFSAAVDHKDAPVTEPLSTRLFKRRVEMVHLLDQPVFIHALPDEVEQLKELRNALAAGLLSHVQGMTLDNFLVRPHLRQVEKYSEGDAWEKLDSDAELELTEHLADLPSAVPEDELEARQFDHLILTGQLALMQGDAGVAGCQKKVTKIASSLEELDNIPLVAKQMELIAEVQTPEFWQDITLGELEMVRKRLRGLVQLIPKASQNIIYTDFQDEVGEASTVELPMQQGVDRVRFRERALHFVQQHMDHISLQKLHRNQQLTAQDLEQLEQMFLSEGVADIDRLRQVQEASGLGLFIRELIGLDRPAAVKALDQFTTGRGLSPNQIEFVNLVIDCLTEQGYMEASRLYDPPFTDLNDMGVEGIFDDEQVTSLMRVLREVRDTAIAV